MHVGTIFRKMLVAFLIQLFQALVHLAHALRPTGLDGVRTALFRLRDLTVEILNRHPAHLGFSHRYQ